MRKTTALLIAMMLGLLGANATNTISVADITIPQGGTGDIQVCLQNDLELTAFEMHFTLPEGITMAGWQAETGRLTDHSSLVTSQGCEVTATSFSVDNTLIAGNSGSLLTITLKAGANLEPGTTLTATLHDLVFSTPEMVEVNPEETTFTITIGEQQSNCEVSVADITIPQGGTGDIHVCLQNDIDLTAFEMYITLPEGVTMAGWQADTERLTNHSSLVTNRGCEVTATSFSADNTLIAGNSGSLLTITLKADANLEPGTTLTATLHDMVFSTPEMVEVNPEETTFTITIDAPMDNRIVLDEDAVSAPEDAVGANVRVIRNIYANEWSTIVLPFAMTAEQMCEAFGYDVQLGNFVSWNSQENDEEEIVSIHVMFERVTDFQANHPYIIKVGKNITEFMVDNVDIHAASNPTVQVGTKKADRGKFIGTYTANTTVPEENLFISGNKFWYSVGKTTMKAFRAYFELADVLDAYYNNGNANVMILLNDSDGIANYERQAHLNTEGVYDLLGRKVAENGTVPIRKGIYIINGKKTVK